MKQTVFTCDNCKTQSPARVGFPYKEGWVYLFQIDMKSDRGLMNAGTNDPVPQIIRDGHFCSPKCFGSFLVEKAATRFDGGKVEKKNKPSKA